MSNNNNNRHRLFGQPRQCDQSLPTEVAFQESILNTQKHEGVVNIVLARKQRDRQRATQEMLASGYRPRVGPGMDWRRTENYKTCVSKFTPSPSEKLDPVSLTSCEEYMRTPQSEHKQHFRHFDRSQIHSQFVERKAMQKTAASTSKSSRAVTSHINTPFYKPDPSDLHERARNPPQHRTKSELITARKQRDYQVAQSTFGTPSSLGFGSDFNCGRKDMDSVNRKINSIVQ